MAKILVLYHSNSGQTEKMAKLIAAGAAQVANTQVRWKSIEQASDDDVFWCDGMAVGWCDLCGRS